MIIKINAKVNLSLVVTGVSGCMHTLDMVVASAEDIYDVVKVNARTDRHVTLSGMNYSDSNTAVRAAKTIIEKYGVTGVDIVINKGIPFEAGLGGSSADGAAVINAMRSLYCIDDEAGIKQLSSCVGSDVYYMTKGGFARLTGYGEEIEVFDSQPIAALIIKPHGGVSTARAFELFDKCSARTDCYNDELISALRCGEIMGVGRFMTNHLFDAAVAINGNIESLIRNVEQASGCCGAVLTGSGSGIVGVFENIASAKIAEQHLRSKCEFAKATYLK